MAYGVRQVLFPSRSAVEKELLSSVVSELPSLAKEALSSTRYTTTFVAMP